MCLTFHVRVAKKVLWYAKKKKSIYTKYFCLLCLLFPGLPNLGFQIRCAQNWYTTDQIDLKYPDYQQQGSNQARKVISCPQTRILFLLGGHINESMNLSIIHEVIDIYFGCKVCFQVYIFIHTNNQLKLSKGSKMNQK